MNLTDLNIALGLLFVSGLILGAVLSWLIRGALVRREQQRAMRSREPWGGNHETFTCDRRL